MSDVPPRLASGALRPRWWPTWALVAALAIVGRLPYAARVALGRGLGRCLYYLMARRRRIASANLAHCLSSLGERQRRQLLKEHFRELGVALFDTAAAWSISARALDRLTRIRGLEHVEAALSRGHGLILLCGHFACLNMAMQLTSRHLPARAIYRPSKNPVLDYVIVRGRGRQGARMFPREDMRTLLRALRDNDMVWFSPDQDHGLSQGEFVPFFGQPAATVTTTARIAARTGAAVLPLVYRRLPGATGYDIEVLPALEDFPGEDIAVATRRLNRVLEQQTYLAPAQYLWVHRRFKTRPLGETSIYLQ